MKTPSPQKYPATTPVPTSSRAEIHMDRLIHNIDVIRDKLGAVELVGVVKADAYGHGSIAVSKALEAKGVSKLAVATVAEAVTLRMAGIESDLIVFAPPMPDRVHSYADFNLQAVVESRSTLEILEKAQIEVQCHVKVDTGMGRLGQGPEASVELIRAVENGAKTKLASVWTHFARADESDQPFTTVQFDRFTDLIKALGGAPAPLHSAASASTYTFPPSIDPSLMSMARIGIALYGLLDLPSERPPKGLQPVMEFVSKVCAIKTVPEGTPISYGARWISPSVRRIATVSAGYADGVSRLLSREGIVRIGQITYPIVGTVCMDMFMVDLGNPLEMDSEVVIGDDVTIFGKNSPTCFEVADLCSSITYVQVCSVSSRVPRNYLS